ncbi:cytochrome P450 [Salinigranum salinum]|uniref:cytochrome P450 n=1 Tax=Salinigranum salinum TaxID=1364937 RepID=UPI001260904C|nr:cytochrome P450 [Salinigranum salinum]
MSAEPPGPRGLPVIGNTGQYARDPFSFITACAEAYGDVAHFELGPIDTYMITNPADIERVLLTDSATYRKPKFQDDAIGDLLGDGLLLGEGERWRKQRDLAQPAFLMSRLSGLSEMMVEYTEEMLAGWDDGDVVNVELEMARITVKIIVEAMFGATIDDERVRILQENLEPIGARFEPNPFRFAIPDWAPTRENRDYRRALSAIEEVVWDLIDERDGTQYDDGDDADGEQPMDLLSILLRARDEGEQTDEDLRDEMVTMLLAGHDTTALTLTYTWYLLSEHPEVESRLHAEFDDLLGGRLPTFADVRGMEYTEAVLQEAMRLYPPVYTIFREPQVDVRLGGYRVPAGSAVMLPQWAVHRSERYWDAPLTFDPDRWLDERADERPRFAYFPFGGGPRFCIGKQLSLLEARLILGTTCPRYRLEYVGEEPFDLRGSLTMHPRQPMEMRVVER